MTFERGVCLVLWLGLLGVSIGWAPPSSPDTTEVIVKMMTGRLEGVNQALFALFNLMGVFPMVFLAVLASDSTSQKVPKWPFLLASFVVGAFALLPYLMLRQWHLPRREPTSWWLRLLSSRAFALLLLVAALVLVVVFITGDLAAFAELFRTQQFPFVMSFDFVACCAAAALLAREEAQLRGQASLGWWGLVPAIGLPLALAIRRRVEA